MVIRETLIVQHALLMMDTWIIQNKMLQKYQSQAFFCSYCLVNAHVRVYRSHLVKSSSTVMVLGSGEYLGVVSGAGLTDWLPLM